MKDLKSSFQSEKAYKIFDSIKDVEPTKEWKVKLNNDLDENSLTNEAVYVRDDSGTIIQTKLTVDQDQRTILIAPPDKGYQSGKSYTLYIEDTLLTSSGKQLKEPVKMEFTISDKNFKGCLLIVQAPFNY